MNSRVIVVGDAAVDLIVHFPRFIDGDRKKVEYTTPSLHGGGTGANTAVALARLEVPITFIGTVGDDSYGRYVLNDLKKEGVDTEFLFMNCNLSTVCVFAFIDEAGERYLWGWPRENQAHREIPIDQINLDQIRSVSWVHSTGMLLAHESSGRRAVISLLKEAYNAGVTTSLDLNLRVNAGQLETSYREAVLEAMEYCSYVFGSGDEEFHYLNPCPTWEESASSFVRPQRSIVVRMGARGAMLMESGGECLEPAFRVKVTDTVGAGDVFNGGFIAARLLGKDHRIALQWGNAVSAYKLSHASARACPTIRQLEKFLASHPTRTMQ
jgi:sugar/nucleoside kinase (ribokinase family)